MKNVFRIITVVAFVIGVVGVSAALVARDMAAHEMEMLGVKYDAEIQSALASIEKKVEALEERPNKPSYEEQWAEIASIADAELRPVYKAIVKDSRTLANSPKWAIGPIDSDLKKVLCWRVYVRAREDGKTPSEALAAYIKYVN